MEIVAKILRMPKTLSDILRKSAKEKGHTLNSLILQILWNWEKENTHK